MPIERYLKKATLDFLDKKMVFIGGPRQVGKTTHCLQFLPLATAEDPSYLNWDNRLDAKKIRSGELPATDFLVLDEIHKYKGWRNLIKGFYDKKKESQKFLITGSARLDHYRRGGDSLLGRYRYLRMHPLSVAELGLTTTEELQVLMKFGGFPEPYFAQNEKTWKLWNQERLYRIINDDIRDLESTRNLSLLEALAESLGERVASPLSINNIALDLNVNHRTAENWIAILERIYYCYRIPPLSLSLKSKINTVKKEKKLYLWDWSAVSDEGPKFENFVAGHLLKYCHFIEDTEGDKMDLSFLRDIEKREIDFVVSKNKKPLFAVECKTGDKKISEHLSYFKKRTSIPFFYQVHLGENDYEPESGIRMLPFVTFSKLIKLI